MRVLATKLLSPEFKDRLIHHGFSVVEFPFISISPQPISAFEVENHVIFTSQNAVQIAFKNKRLNAKLQGKKFFCVGEKTKSLLSKNGQKAIKMSQNSLKLARFLAKNYKNESFSFFCGDLRRPEIESVFLDHQMQIQPHEIYKTTLTPKQFTQAFEGILFYSPSAVESFFQKNTWQENTQGFCLGTTTARKLNEFTENYSIAKTPSESHLLLTLTQHFRQSHA